MNNKKQKIALVTGSAGFIGFHISKRLLNEGWRVIGLDCMSAYYDVSLKEKRESMLLKYESYKAIHEKVERRNVLLNVFELERPDVVIHLAAQAGVRYSIENPRAYLETNINGTFELLEAARAYPPEHMLLASTSSVYGANTSMPFSETHRTDHQVSIYAATKKSTESLAHSYAHLFALPITMFRFFTVYGPWGRPDMAYYKFTKAIAENIPIDVYNNGHMKRDFTYIDDLINSIYLLISRPPLHEQSDKNTYDDSISKVADFRVVNIGNRQPIGLMDFIQAIENSIGIKAKFNFLPMQPGDVDSTWADNELLQNLTAYSPSTPYNIGIDKFVKWYRVYNKL